MKRDRRLQGLSSEHHHALVLARSLRHEVEQGTWTEEKGKRFARVFDHELQSHFLTEEELLLSELQKTANTSMCRLVERTREDHEALRVLAGDVSRGDARAAEEFAQRLYDHVRFEERELFPTCEKHLEDKVLDAVLRRAPKSHA